VGVVRGAERLDEARERVGPAGLADPIELVECSAELPPFADASFDGLTFTCPLRYVDDPGAPLRELARVVRPGGSIASLEFDVPQGIWRGAWEAYVRVGLPVAGRAISPGWSEVGRFLGPSIRRFAADYPPERLLALWRDAGTADVRARRL